MLYRQIGNSKVTASAITFGAWAIGGTMWGGSDENKAIAAIQKSIELGVTSIDTAPVYGFGKSEELVAKAIKGKRQQVQIFTKYGLDWQSNRGEQLVDVYDPASKKTYKVYGNASKKRVIAECEESLRRLRTDYIDLYQCHWRDHTTTLEETMEAINQLLKEGKILAAGVSNFTVEDIVEASALAPIVCDQPPYSMVLRDIEKDVLP